LDSAKNSFGVEHVLVLFLNEIIEYVYHFMLSTRMLQEMRLISSPKAVTDGFFILFSTIPITIRQYGVEIIYISHFFTKNIYSNYKK